MGKHPSTPAGTPSVMTIVEAQDKVLAGMNTAIDGDAVVTASNLARFRVR